MNDPFGFLWGSATSSHQVEGYNEKNDWWAWEQKGHIEGGVRSGPATDHWNRFREDLKLAKDLGHNTYRFSVEWSRLQPEPGRWDYTAFDWYESLIAECEKLGLLPMLTLHHFTSPQWFAELGGFTSPQAPALFEKYVLQVVRKLGGRIPLWCTLNEPMVLVAGTYLGTFMPPARFDPKAASKACHTLLDCHVRAYRVIHQEPVERSGPWKNRPVQVGLAHNMLDFMPDRAWHPIELWLTRQFWNFYNRSWLDAVTGRPQNFGVFGFVPKSPVVPDALGKTTVDFLGVNYYTKAYVRWRPREPAPERPPLLPIGVSFARRKEEVSDVDWAVHPAGFSKILDYAGRYGLPIYVTENGIADQADRLRPTYLVEHLKVVAEKIKQGIDIQGYYHWSLLDNFEWIKGFGPRFGLFQVDFNNFERKPTRSAQLMKELIDLHRDESGEPGAPSVELIERIKKGAPASLIHKLEGAP
jgi:beta-glucosidase